MADLSPIHPLGYRFDVFEEFAQRCRGIRQRGDALAQGAFEQWPGGGHPLAIHPVHELVHRPVADGQSLAQLAKFGRGGCAEPEHPGERAEAGPGDGPG